jgi:hypothetical protein
MIYCRDCYLVFVDRAKGSNRCKSCNLETHYVSYDDPIYWYAEVESDD